MKKISFILFLLTTTLFVACDDDDSSEDDGGSEITASIVGDWSLVGFNIDNGATVTEFSGQSFTVDYSSYGTDFDTQVSFSEDPNIVSSSGSYTTVLTYSFLGAEETQEVPSQEFNIVGTWNLTDNQLTISNTEGEYVATVITLTETSLVFEIEIDEDLSSVSGFEGLDISGSTTGTAVYTLSR